MTYWNQDIFTFQQSSSISTHEALKCSGLVSISETFLHEYEHATSLIQEIKAAIYNISLSLLVRNRSLLYISLHRSGSKSSIISKKVYKQSRLHRLTIPPLRLAGHVAQSHALCL